ncbi:TPA: hypothetical protein ACGIK9_003376 [Acinetobacter baumannii]|uniref:hypothetical protein n=1 Tax=Acinetobacter baumannii TaxID=470 RepID=UPI00338D3AAD
MEQKLVNLLAQAPTLYMVLIVFLFAILLVVGMSIYSYIGTAITLLASVSIFGTLVFYRKHSLLG